MEVVSKLAAMACAAILVAACGQSRFPASPSVGIPTQAPRTRIAPNGPCVLVGSARAPGSNGSNAPLEVGKSPDYAVVIWVPGLNARPCRAAMTRIGKSAANALAGAIDAAPLFPKGTFNCPADDGGAADVYFAYRGAPSVARVWISLAGCRPVVMEDRWPRQLDSSIMDLLRAGAPQAWEHYLSG